MIPWKSLCCVAIPISLLKTYHKFWNKSPQGNLDPNLTITKRNTWYDSCIFIYVLYVFKPLQCLTKFQFVKVLSRWKNFLVSFIFSCYLQTYVPLCHNFPLRKSLFYSTSFSANQFSLRQSNLLLLIWQKIAICFGEWLLQK